MKGSRNFCIVSDKPIIVLHHAEDTFNLLLIGWTLTFIVFSMFSGSTFILENYMNKVSSLICGNFEGCSFIFAFLRFVKAEVKW